MLPPCQTSIGFFFFVVILASDYSCLEGCGVPELVTPFQGSASPVASREEKVSSPPIMVLNFGLWNVNLCNGTVVVVLLGSKLQF